MNINKSNKKNIKLIDFVSPREKNKYSESDNKNFKLNTNSDSMASVAYLGPIGTFSHFAAVKIFGDQSLFVPQQNIFDIFNAVETGHVMYGVVPVENSIEGSINLTLDLLKDSDLTIYGEKTVNISHNLIGNGKIADIKEVFSHPQVLGQCRNWLRKNCPEAHLIETSSSSAAVRRVKKTKTQAAIGTFLSAKMEKIPVIEENIQDFKTNKTRFFILSKEKIKPGKNNKTSLVFLCHDKPGALVEVLKIFKKHEINLTKIESRPSKRKDWEYYFYIDLNGHEEEPEIKKALEKLKQVTIYVKILGSYPVN
ncbi:MAG: chorismate mutase/prephenate dehydratase [uncultured bacterium]|nr:MAG: chorismate mutase/prephenate dehydratase [uncultured bacterium]